MQLLKNIFIPHKNNSYKPHAISYIGLSLFALVILGSQVTYNLQATGNFKVLGYATSISSGELLSLTNSSRTTNGLPALTISGQLNQSAQAKAAHMSANDYWAHNAPDGTTPWFFFGQAGYSYVRAGENLAAGYYTSSSAHIAWMNSPTHAANILDAEFTEIGFGIFNGPSFQGGESTIVVAHYAKPYTAPIAEPVIETPIVTQQTTSPEPTPVSQSEPESIEVETEVLTDENGQRYLARLADDGTIIIIGSPAPADPASTTTNNLDTLISGEAHWTLYLAMGAMSALAGIYFVRHLRALQQLIIHGEHYLEGHPLLEASIVYLALWVMLFSGVGAIL